jgi:hypothetical protein
MHAKVVTALAMALATANLLPAAASAAPEWAPASSATVHPGVRTVTADAGCTSNFVFYDSAGKEYIGQAAHCSGTGDNTATDGCTSGSLPTGTEVDVSGASKPGVMVYNSWLAMQSVHESNANTCEYNDFALVKLDSADYGSINPSIPFWGGPTGVGTAAKDDYVYSYGKSESRSGDSTLSAKSGSVGHVDGGGWDYNVTMDSPGVPGDSGSAFLNANGQALGVLSTLELAPDAGSNGVGDIGRELAYAQAHSGIAGLTLATGTEPFSTGTLGPPLLSF